MTLYSFVFQRQFGMWGMWVVYDNKTIVCISETVWVYDDKKTIVCVCLYSETIRGVRWQKTNFCVSILFQIHYAYLPRTSVIWRNLGVVGVLWSGNCRQARTSPQTSADLSNTAATAFVSTAFVAWVDPGGRNIDTTDPVISGPRPITDSGRIDGV